MGQRSQINPLFAALLLLVGVVQGPAEAAESPQGDLSVRLYQSFAVANLPIAFRMKVANSGNVPFSYWCGGPGRYPPGDEFVAVIAAADGATKEYRLSNGQYTQGGSGSGITIRPGDATWLPVVLEPLPVGRYTLQQIHCDARGSFPRPGAPMDVYWPAMSIMPNQTFEVRDNPVAADRISLEMLARVRKYEPFAEHVASTYKIPAVMNAMLQDLESEDSTTAGIAAEFYFKVDSHRPAEFMKILGRAISKRLGEDIPDWNLLSLLGSLAEQEGTDEALGFVLKYVLDDRSVHHSRYVLQHLFNFSQPAATHALRRFIADPDRNVRFTAAVGLSKRLDPAAVPVLIAASQDVSHPDRSHALYRLADYHDNPQATAAVVAASHDPDEAFRKTALSVLEMIERDRKWRAQAATLPSTLPATFPATTPAGTGR